LITNAAAGSTGEPLSHQEVIDAGIEASGRFTTLVRGIIRKIG
jgi:purine-nucleoside phosphorylase